MDAKLARGHVRSELRSIKKAPLIFDDVHALILPSLKKIFEGRKLDAFEIKQVVNSLSTCMADCPNMLSVDRIGSGKTLSKRKFFDGAGSLTLYIHPESGFTTLERMHVELSATEATISSTTPPVQFSTHAFERFLERGGSSDEAAWNVATEVIRAMGLLSLFVMPATELPERGLALPIGDGLLLGTVDDSFHGRPTKGFCFAMQRSVRRGVDNPQAIGPAFFSQAAQERAWVFHAKTYIGPNELHERQRRFIDRCRAILDRHGALIDVIGLGATDATNPRYLNVCRADSPHASQIDEAIESAIDIVMDASMARAMGNSGAPSARPERVTAHYQRQLANHRKTQMLDTGLAETMIEEVLSKRPQG